MSPAEAADAASRLPHAAPHLTDVVARPSPATATAAVRLTPTNESPDHAFPPRNTASAADLDLAIVAERARYAAERCDYDACTAGTPVREILTALDRKPAAATRRVLVDLLLDAQCTSPHRLWELLLVRAFQAELVRRRRAISVADDAEIDALVIETFLAAMVNPPWSVDLEGLAVYVLRTSRRALTKALAVHRAASTPALAA